MVSGMLSIVNAFRCSLSYLVRPKPDVFGFGAIRGIPVAPPMGLLPPIPPLQERKPPTAEEMDTLMTAGSGNCPVFRPSIVYETKDAKVLLDGIRLHHWEVVERRKAGLFRVKHGEEDWNIKLYKLEDGKIMLQYWRGGEIGALIHPVLTSMLEKFMTTAKVSIVGEPRISLRRQ